MSNHLGDTNKMVRDTPRMDASAHDDGAIWQTGCQLERELNAANSEIERLTNKVAQLYEGAEEQKQRIKRLEEAGDRMRLFCADPDDCFAWDKAKEAKL
jgi:hypothetical protein